MIPGQIKIKPKRETPLPLLLKAYEIKTKPKVKWKMVWQLCYYVIQPSFILFSGMLFMIQASTYRAPHYLIDKLLHFLDFLKTEKDKYECAAQAVSDRQMRYTITNLAQESNQYGCELLSQLQSLGANVKIEQAEKNIPIEFLKPVADAGPNQSDLTTLQLCRESEKQMITAYRAILNEPFLMEDLRKLMRAQLNGILCAFLQLKLLGQAG